VALKLVTAISTRNRPLYLENCVRSFRQLFGYGDLLVVDDASDDDAQRRLLERLESEGVRVLRLDRAGAGIHGGLYAGLDAAVDHAAAEGYDVLQLVQDDMQFMWHDDLLLERLTRLFDLPDVVQVAPTFFKGILAPTMARRVVLEGASDCYRVPGYGMSDTGFVRVDRLVEESFRFGPSEADVSGFWLDRGFRLAVLHAPFLAWLPFPDQLAARPPAEELYLRPLGRHAVSRFLARDLAELPYHEDWCRPWGWRTLSPYWFTRLGPEYVRLLAARRRLPRRVPLTGGAFTVPDSATIARSLARAVLRRAGHTVGRGSRG
jgi:glycosyltransferase involved in cell wall biosynthesis